MMSGDKYQKIKNFISFLVPLLVSQWLNEFRFSYDYHDYRFSGTSSFEVSIDVRLAIGTNNYTI